MDTINTSHPKPLPDSPLFAELADDAFASRWPVLCLVLIAALGAVWGGPGLGDHEAIVAQGARDMRLTGDWLVPTFLDTPFIRKPPLPNWLVACASYLFPNDPATGLPVTASVARLPSALAALGTVLLLWRLASAMFGARSGRITAVLAASSVFILLYAPNATVEMLLTFCCTWAYFHFWFAVTARTPAQRRMHYFLFYLAMGFGMLAKGPAPIAVVAVPLFVWWFLARPLRVLARGGPSALRHALVSLARGFWPRAKAALTRTWLLPGLLVFSAVFVPWMIAVARVHPHAWNLWNWQYMQRAQGAYDDTRARGVFYYVPVVLGLVMPWLFLFFEALAAPWLARYARYRRALLYAGIWAVMGVVTMSLMEFKKPYYVLPALPGFALLLGVVAERFYSNPMDALRRHAGLVLGALVTLLAVGLGLGYAWARREAPAVAGPLLLIGPLTFTMVVAATGLYLRGRGWPAFVLTAVTTVTTFHAAWYVCGPALDNVDRVALLAKAMDEHGIASDATVMWADQRPDARLSFYFNRRTRHMLPASEIVARLVNRSGKRGKDAVRQMAVDRAEELLAGSEPVYLILERENYEQMKQLLGELGRLVTVVDSDPNGEDKDWVVVANGR